MDDEEKHSIEHLKELAQKEDADKLAQGVVDYTKDVLGDLCNQPGAIFYNGRSTLKTGDIYLMGLNPGGNPVKNAETINETLNKWMIDPADFSGYCDEDWSTDRKTYKIGKAPHQQRVKKLCKILCAKQELLDQEEVYRKEKVRTVFSANAIFIRSNKQDDLQESLTLFEQCWPVHQLFLSIVRPNIILCLGNGELLSAFALLRSKLATNANPSSDKVKVFAGDVALSCGDKLSVRVIGVRHPSWPFFNPANDLKLYLEKNPNLLNINGAGHT